MSEATLVLTLDGYAQRRHVRPLADGADVLLFRTTEQVAAA